MNNQQNDSRNLGQMLAELEKKLDYAILNNAGQNFPFCQLDRQYLSAVDELVSATLNNRPCEELEAFLKDRLEKHFPTCVESQLTKNVRSIPNTTLLKSLDMQGAMKPMPNF